MQRWTNVISPALPFSGVAGSERGNQIICSNKPSRSVRSMPLGREAFAVDEFMKIFSSWA